VSRTRWAVVGVATALGLFMFFGGALVIANGTPYTYTTSSWTGSWGMLPALVGLLVLGVVAFAVWDAN